MRPVNEREAIKFASIILFIMVFSAVLSFLIAEDIITVA
jgi:hypothetical protein